jgi:NADH-quinone oxidoreductase subunit E
VSHFNSAMVTRARPLVALYPERRSALLPLCHLAQEQDGWLRPEAMEEIADLVGVTPAEVRGTATFYDMLHTEPVGKYVVAVCTNIACILDGAAELLAHAEERLGIRVGGTTADGLFTLEESECLADCDYPPCVQVNHRFVRTTTAEQFDALVGELSEGGHADDIPPHGTLVRIRRTGGLRVDPGEIARERAQVEGSSKEGTG